jgi:hypothetical protein
LAYIAVVLVATVSACGGGGTQTATPAQNNQMAPTTAPDKAMASGDGMAADGAGASASGDPGMAADGDGAMASGDPGMAADGDGAMPGGKGNEMGGGMEEEKLPMGMTGAKAVAAGMGKDGNPVVSVTATETTCKANKASVPAGTVWFKMTNKGMKFNELYLEDGKGKEYIQAANVKAGQVGAFKFKVKEGKWQVACELEDKGKQIRVPITVTAAMM